MPELMKGATWSARKSKVKYPLIAEIKEDEIRCHIKINPADNSVKYLSYAGKELHNMQCFNQMWVAFGYLSGRTEFDSGFLVNGNFNDSYRWVRSSKGLPADLSLCGASFILFDLPESTGMYSERGYEMQRLLETPAVRLCPVYRPVTRVVHAEHEVHKMFDSARDLGFEGLMLKTQDHKYQRKRSNDWIKYKPSEDADGIIVGLHEAVSDTDDIAKGLYKGKPLGRIGSVTLRMEDGSTATPHGIAHDLGREMYLDPQKFLHQWAEMTFMERDRQGGYRHPVFKRLREAKA